MGSTIANENCITTQFITLCPPVNPLVMQSGARLSNIQVAYEVYGELNSACDNVILVCHALTGSAHAAGLSSSDPRSVGWWDPMIGEGRAFDTQRYCVICSNFLGSCYGTTGPTSINPETGRIYGMSFPQMTVRDMINVQKALLDALGVKALHAVVGGSLGGMQVLEWGIMYPGFVRSLIPIATASQHSPWCIGLNELARQAIMNDSEWKNGNYDPHQQPVHGLSLARQIAMISYRSDISFQSRFGRTRVHEESPGFGSSSLFNVESYLRYQGKKLVDRFDANTYIYISRAMDVHDVAVGRGDVPAALSRIVVPTMVIGISSDILYPVHEQKTIASTIADAEYEQIDSPHGHDAFLIEYEQLSTIVSEFFHRML